MAGGFPNPPDLSAGASSGNTVGSSGSGGTAITTGAANTKGSWTTLSSGLTYDTACACLIIEITPASTQQFFVDLGVGSAGNEQVLWNNIPVATGAFGNTQSCLLAPLDVPASTRIAARAQAVSATQTVNVGIQTFSDGFFDGGGFSEIDALGVTTASTSLTATTTGVGVLGSYTTLVASTARDYCGLAVYATAPAVQANYWVSIAIGGSGSEQVVIPLYNFWVNSSLVYQSFSPVYYVPVASGSRISAATANSSGGAATLNVAVYGVYQ